jgi:hypothetical protein
MAMNLSHHASRTVLCLLVAVGGCSATRHSSLGSDGAGGGAGADRLQPGSAGAIAVAHAGDAGGDAIGVGVTDAGARGELHVSILNPDNVVLSVVTLGCPRECVDVTAVASGGQTPFAYRWDDGSTEASRRLCPTQSAQFKVTATEASAAGVEFPAPPRSAVATLVVDVSACQDAGDDAGPPPKSGSLCFENGSFEGTPSAALVWTASPSGLFDAKPWEDCDSSSPDSSRSTPDIFDQASDLNVPAPSDGKTYLHFGAFSQMRELVTQHLCSPLRAGVLYKLRLDLATQPDYDPGQLEIYGSAGDCERGELLWTSEILASGWQTYCVTLAPKNDADYLTLSPIGPQQSGAFVLVDHLVAVDGCP